MQQAQQDLSTFEAAAILHVSGPFLIKLLDAKAIPHIKVGSHRSISLNDVLRYKHVRDQDRDKGMELLVRMSEELGLYDCDE